MDGTDKSSPLSAVALRTTKKRMTLSGHPPGVYIYRCKKRLLLVFETEMLHIDGLHLGHTALLGRLLEVLA